LFLTFIWRISVFYSVGSGGGNNPRVVSGQKLTNNRLPNRKNTVDLYAGGMQLQFLVLILFMEIFCRLYYLHIFKRQNALYGELTKFARLRFETLSYENHQ
jgi:hypothetical protein